MKEFFLCSFCSLLLTTLIGQSTEPENHHHDQKNELGIANSPVYFLKEKTINYGFHAHYVRTIGESNFGYGVGYEKIFDEHKHTTYSLLGSYRYKHFWNFIASPGITFEGTEREEGGRFAFHAEVSYEWEIGDIHIGPSAEIAYDPEDYHFSLGLHIGYCF